MSKQQPKPDIRQLGERELPETEFPVKADRFRVFLDPNVHDKIQEHAKRDLTVEIGGVLVGGWERDADGPFVAVRDVICSELAASGAGELTFTHDAWAEIHRVMDADYADSSIVGWYHTHPDFGIFLSERDQFIHEHFFSDPGQIAYVVDPIRIQEGVFVWRGGKTVLCQHYWVGDEIRTAPESPEVLRGRGSVDSSEDSTRTSMRPEPMRSDWLLIALLGVLFFLIGYLLADRKTAWERQRIVDGAMAHFGTKNVLRLGLRQNLGIVALEIERLRNDLPKFRPEETDGTATLTRAELEKWSQRLRQTRDALGQIEAKYCFDEWESAALAKLIAEAQLASPGKPVARDGAAAPASPAPLETPSPPVEPPSSPSAEAPSADPAPTEPQGKESE